MCLRASSLSDNTFLKWKHWTSLSRLQKSIHQILAIYNIISYFNATMTSQSESHKWTEGSMKQLQTLCIADLDHNIANAHLKHYMERNSDTEASKILC
jgi:hypothetical protein